jgi:hypothetical protein
MEAMDLDDEMMFAALLEEEAVVVAAVDKHLMMISCRLVVYSHDDNRSMEAWRRGATRVS